MALIGPAVRAAAKRLKDAWILYAWEGLRPGARLSILEMCPNLQRRGSERGAVQSALRRLLEDGVWVEQEEGTRGRLFSITRAARVFLRAHPDPLPAGARPEPGMHTRQPLVRPLELPV